MLATETPSVSVGEFALLAKVDERSVRNVYETTGCAHRNKAGPVKAEKYRLDARATALFCLNYDAFMFSVAGKTKFLDWVTGIDPEIYLSWWSAIEGAASRDAFIPTAVPPLENAWLELSSDIYIRMNVRIVETVARSLKYVKARDAWIASDPAIMAGSPVLAGTRIPVHVVLERVESGESPADLLEDWPHLAPEAIEAALLYARANPRVGRPPKVARKRPPERAL